jgi:ribosomal protein L37E
MNSITCPKCGRTSHHPKDVETGYCGACHEFTAMGYKIARKIARGIPVNFRFSCISWDDAHVKFNLFDFLGANCGQICIRTFDVDVFFGRQGWQGIIEWNGLRPVDK